MPSKAAGTGDPGQFLGEDLARRVRGDERGGWLGLVGGGGGTGIEITAGADRNLDVVKGTCGFDDTVPAKRGAGFGEGGDLVRQFAAIDAGLERSDGVAVENQAHQ